MISGIFGVEMLYQLIRENKISRCTRKWYLNAIRPQEPEIWWRRLTIDQRVRDINSVYGVGIFGGRKA
jgi:hypothetical protein